MRQEWRCRRCGKLLGIRIDGRVHIHFTRGHQYLVGYPTTVICRKCKTLNEIDTRYGTGACIPPTDSEKED